MPNQLDNPPLHTPLVDPRTGLVREQWRPWISRLTQAAQFATERWSTAERPTRGLFIGRVGFNTTLGVAEWWTGSAWVTASAGDFLPLAGGTMAGAIAMGGNKITGAGAATANGDVLRYEQLLGVVTAAELGYLAGVTSGIQAQIDALAAKHELLHVRDEKAANTGGGTFTSGAWRTRTLNTVKTNEITGASLASNQITLPAGTYDCEAYAIGYFVNRHKAILYDVTNSADVLIGTSEYSGDSDGLNINIATSKSQVVGRFTLAAATVLELRHRCQTTCADSGFGIASNFGVVEVYSEVRIWKVA